MNMLKLFMVLLLVGLSFSWQNNTFYSYRQLNITSTLFNGSSVYFNLTALPSTGVSIFTTNSTGTELPCGGFYWLSNQTSNRWVLNCTLANGTTAIGWYYNNVTAAYNSTNNNITKAAIIGDDFYVIDANVWTNAGGACSIAGANTVACGAAAGIQSNTAFANKTVVEMFAYHPPQPSGKYGGIGFTDQVGTYGGGQEWFAVGLGVPANYDVRTYGGAAVTDVDTRINATATFQTFMVKRNARRGDFYINGSLANTTTSTLPDRNTPVGMIILTPAAVNTIYTDWIVIYQDLGEFGYNATITAWGNEVNNTAVPLSINSQSNPSPQYEGVQYNYSINYTIGGADLSSSSQFLVYNGTSFAMVCSNVSKEYYCYYNHVEAVLVQNNNTNVSGKFALNITDAGGDRTINVSFNVSTYWGVWPTNMSSEDTVTELDYADINMTYQNASMANLTVTAAAHLAGVSGAMSCSAGFCSVSLQTPDISTAEIYMIEANMTVSSAYWGNSVNRNVRVERFVYLQHGEGSYTGAVTNPANAYDNNWNTYAVVPDGGAIFWNYSLGYIVPINFTYRDAYTNSSNWTNDDCLAANMSFKLARSGTAFEYSCLNYTSGTYNLLANNSMAGGNYWIYEQNITLKQNNSYTRLLPFGLTTCDVGSLLFNYTCYDEINKSEVSCDYSQTFIMNTTIGNQIVTFNGTDNNWPICIFPAGLQGNISSTEEITAVSYDTRFFFLFNSAINISQAKNLSRYAGWAATTELTFIYVKSAGVGLPGKYVYVQRLYIDTNNFETVSMGRTNDEGTAIVYVEPNDAFYKFMVVDETGEVIYSSSTQQVGCSAAAASCEVTLNTESTSIEFWNYQEGMASNCSYSNASKIVACSFLVVDGTEHTFTLEVWNWSGTGNKTLLHSTSSTTSSGTLWYDLGDANTTGNYVYYLRANSVLYILDGGSITMNPIVNWGWMGLFMTICFVLVFAGLGTAFGPSGVAIMTYVAVVIAYFLRFMQIDMFSLVALGVIVGVIVYALRQ